MIKKKHWLFGEIRFNVEVIEEDKCHECLHAIVCARNMEKFCLNYDFGNSEEGCQSCIHRFARWDKDKIPCFKCKYFSKKEEDLEKATGE